MKPLSERFRNILEALEITPYKLAADFGLPQATIYNIYNGKTKPNSELLEKLCEIEPRISAEYLLRGEGFPLRSINFNEEINNNSHIQRIAQLENELRRQNTLLLDLQDQLFGITKNLLSAFSVAK